MPIGAADPDAFAPLMLVNVLAPLRIVDRYRELVAPQGTVAVMTSGLGSVELNTIGGYEAYRTSKAALNMGLRSIFARAHDQSIPSLTDMLEQRHGSGGIAFGNYANQEHPW